MKRVSSVIILGVGFLICAGSPARAQWGDMGDAVKKGAADAAKQKMQGAAEKAGLPAAEAPATPEGGTGAATAPAEEPKAAPAAPNAPAEEPGADTGAPSAPSGD